MGSGDFIGIDITAATVQATSTGQVMLEGRGGVGLSGKQHGIRVQNGGQVIGGSNTVTVVGSGGNTTGDLNYGVLIWNSSSRITSSGGNVSVIGTGGGAGTSVSNYGVFVDNSELKAGGSGTVTASGTGGNTTGTGSYNYGILINGNICNCFSDNAESYSVQNVNFMNQLMFCCPWIICRTKAKIFFRVGWGGGGCSSTLQVKFSVEISLIKVKILSQN